MRANFVVMAIYVIPMMFVLPSSYAQTVDEVESEIKTFFDYVELAFNELIPANVEENIFNTTSTELQDFSDSAFGFLDGILNLSFDGKSMIVNLIEVFYPDPIDEAIVSWIVILIVIIFIIGIVVAILSHMLRLAAILAGVVAVFFILGITPIFE